MKRDKGPRIWNALFPPLVGGALFLLLWHAAATQLQLRPLPLPQDVFASLPSALAQGIVSHAAASLARVFQGLALSLALALFFGIPMGYFPAVDRFSRPLLYFSYPVPKLALLPIVMLLLGVGEAAKICIIALILVFPLLVSVRDAVRAIPEEDFGLFISLRASFWQKLRHIIFPATLPALFSALRVSIGISFSALFFTETFGTDKGLGFYITDCWMRLDYPHMYLGICVLALSGVFLFTAADIGARFFCPWLDRGMVE